MLTKRVISVVLSIISRSEFSGSPFAQELLRTGALSPESVSAIRAGRDPAILCEASSGRWSRFNVLLLWREGARLDAQYLCERLSEFVIAYRASNLPPDIPPFLIDLRLNRILEGKTPDEGEIRSFFGVGSTPVWFAVLLVLFLLYFFLSYGAV